MIGRRPISRAKGNGDVPGILGRFLGTSCRKMYFHLLQCGAWLNSRQAFVLSLRLRRQIILSQFEQSCTGCQEPTLHMHHPGRHRLLVQCKGQKIKAHCGPLQVVIGLPSGTTENLAGSTDCMVGNDDRQVPFLEPWAWVTSPHP